MVRELAGGTWGSYCTGQLPFCDTNAIILEHNIKNCGVLYPKGISKGEESIMRR
jgi:hypothetical protein